MARRFLCRKRYVEILRWIVLGQACGRRFLARSYVIQLRRDTSAKTLQCHYRMWHMREEYLKKKWLAVWCQSMARGKSCRVTYLEMLERHKEELVLNDRRNKAASSLQSLYRGSIARKEVLEMLGRQTKDVAVSEVQPEAVVVLKKQQQQAALQADKAAAIAVQVKQERQSEIDALRHELDAVSSAVSNAKVMAEELASVRAEAELLREELQMSRAETDRVKSRLVAVENENKALKAKIDIGASFEPYKSTRFEEHGDLQKLDERIQNFALRSKQGRKDLDALVQSLAILR
jgi:IQ calmodulin-binding motif